MEEAAKITYLRDTDFLPPQSTDVACLAIPERKEKQLREAGLNTLEQLLRFYPIGYDDYSKPTAISKLEEGKDCVVLGTVKDMRICSKGRIDVLSVTIEDIYGNQAKATWFNQSHVGQQLVAGQTYAFCGKVKLDPTGKYLPSIMVTRFDNKPEKILRILPRYRKVKGMAEDYLLGLIEKSFEITEPADHVHNHFISEFALLTERKALSNIHHPEHLDDLKAAEERLSFDILLPFTYNLMKMEKEMTKPSTFLISKFTSIKKIAADLPYELTHDQKVTINEILVKINTKNQLNALIQGDVGCGKTIIAVMLMAAAAENGMQSCLMAPTEVLATQHYKELQERLACLPQIRIGFLVGSMPAPEKKKVMTAIKTGQIDIVVGTHAVIQKSIIFHKLGLAVIDEQHRFGVGERDALLLRNNPHIISMSATPIPRTLSMALYGTHTAVFNILEKPAGRLPIQTAISQSNPTAYKFIYGQIQKGHQAYVVCPFVEASTNEQFSDVESVRETEKELIEAFAFDPKIKIGSVNGRMKKEEIDQVIGDFSAGKTNILVSTTVVEVGVNVPNATVMVIKNAERFGLAQLHQLRGRVGRSEYKSFCILITAKDTERCKVLCETTDGFKIALADLELRGHGAYLGTKQFGQDFAVELMMGKPDLYQKAQKLSLVIDGDPRFKEAYSYLAKPEPEALDEQGKKIRKKAPRAVAQIGC